MWEQTYQKWLDDPYLTTDLKAQLLAMSELEKEDAFYKTLEFGTAGMRGIMGPGCNRMNIYTIRKLNTAYAQFISDNGSEAKEMGVAIAYDNRHNSYNFALESAKILASHDINVYLFTSLRPTPELSYAVRELGCFGGIVCTASHNPKEYNGYKIYDSKGCQLIPQLIEPVIKYVEAITDELNIKVDLTEQQEKRITYMDQVMDDKYIEILKTVQYYPNAKKTVKIVFTPQHGTSMVNMCRLYQETGYDCILVKEQADPDPDFSNTLVPNPEDPRAYILALEYAKKYDADIVLSTDPDADRMGVQVKHNDGYVFLTGNQTGALLIEYICSSLKKFSRLPDNGLMITTVVTNDLGNEIAKAYGVDVMLALTGFKFIGEKIAQYCDTLEKSFIFGYEESYGSIIQDFVRDKDSLQACLTLAEAANFYKAQGKTLVDVVEELYSRYGYYYDEQENILVPGADGAVKLQKILGELRKESPKELGGLKVVLSEDYGSLIRRSADKEEAITGFVPSDVLKYFLEDGSWVAIRPSGTEPKCKFYYCIKDIDKASCLQKKATIGLAVQQLIQ